MIFNNNSSSFINLNSTSVPINDFIKLNQIEIKNDPEQKIVNELQTELNTYIKWRNNYIKNIYRTQHIILWIFTIMVVLLVASGIYFSIIQLNKSFDIKQLQSLETEIKFEKFESIYLKSNVIGAVVLIISIVFFYLYLKFLYGNKKIIPPEIQKSGNTSSN